MLNNAGFEQNVDSRNRGPSNRGSATPSGTGFRPQRDYGGSVSGPVGRPVGPRPSLERNNESRYAVYLVWLARLVKLKTCCTDLKFVYL